MRKPIHDETIELLLASIYQKSGEGLQSSFFYGKPGARHYEKNFGTEIYYKENKLTRTAIHVRQHGPSYLKYLAISDIWSLLQKFVVENYWYLANGAFLRQFDGSYADNTSADAKQKFSEALAISDIFQPQNKLTIFPLVPIQVLADFDSEVFFLIKSSSLDATRLRSTIGAQEIASERFPPLNKFQGRQEFPSSWLGVRSPAVQASNKIKAAILGAIALTPLPCYRHSFSGRKLFGGRCTFSDGIAVSFGEAHTPPLMQDIIVSEQDKKWLDILALKFESNEKAVRRQIKALEYFYRAWELEPSERFPILCMALDAIFGDVSFATKAVVDSVRNTLGSQLNELRLRHLMELRASVIHGGAPDVYDSSKYNSYYDDYEVDPIRDLQLIVASCLRAKIFDGALKVHSDPNAKAIADAQARGIIPKNLSRNTILEEGE